MNEKDQSHSGVTYHGTEADAYMLENAWTPSVGEYFSASAAQAFDRTLGVRAYEGYQIWSESRDERDRGPVQVFQNEEEYKNSPYYREGVQFFKGMNGTRARIYAENYDQRRNLERIIQAGDENGGWWTVPVGFGGGIFGSLPDPINVIPLGGGALTGARLAAQTTRQALSRSLRTGAIEGAVGNYVSSAVAAWDLNKKGEDITTQDIMVDTMFGAALGPVFHGAGALIGRSRARTVLRNDLEAIVNAMDEGSPLRAEFTNTLKGMHAGEAESFRAGGRVTEALSDAGIVNAIRRAATPEERLEVARSMEIALARFVTDPDAPLNMSPVMDGNRTITEMEIRGLIQGLAADEPVDIDFGTLRPAYKRAINAIRMEEGVSLLEGDNLVIPAAVVQKLMEKRILKDGRSADEVAELLVRVFHGEADFASSTRYPHIQALVSLRNDLADMGFLATNPKTGETVVKSVYTERANRMGKRLGQEERPLRRDARTPSSRSEDISGRPGEEPDGSRQPGRFTDHRSGLADESIRTQNDRVNGAEPPIEKASANSPPDGDDGMSSGQRRVIRLESLRRATSFGAEADPDIPSLPTSSELETVAASMDRTNPDALTPEELQAAALIEDGKLREPDAMELRQVAEDKAYIDKVEESSLRIAGCVMEIVE